MHRSSQFRVNLAIFAYVVAMMMLCTNSSPILNATGTDSSVFRVMGRAMTEGKVMYKDVFDHKGLYIYFINALAVIMSGKSLLGLFIVECVFMLLCARTVYALLSLYADYRVSFLGMQIFMLFVLLRGTLEGSNLTEEYGLLFQVLAVYMLVRDGGKFSCLHMFMQGVLGGIVICMRPNIVMMWGGIAIIAGYELLRRKNFALLAGNIGVGILGVISGIAPAIIYAIITGSLNDMVFGTFTYNFMYLSMGTKGNFLMFMLWRVLKLAKTGSIGRFMLILSVAVPCIIMVVKRRFFPFARYYFAMLAMTVLSLSLSGRNYGHYYESIVPFSLPFAYWVASRFEKVKFRTAVISVCLLTVLFGARFPDSITEILGRKVLGTEDFVKANEPYKSTNERVLVTGNMSIFYDKLEVVPQEKYFYIPATDYDVFPEPRDAQISSILSGVNDVIIVVTPKEDNRIYPETGKNAEIARYLAENYDLLHQDFNFNIIRHVRMYGKKRN